MHELALPAGTAQQQPTNPPSIPQQLPVLRFHAYNEGTIMWANKYIFHFQFGSSGPHSYVIMGDAGSAAAMTTVHLVLNSQLPAAPGSSTNQYDFQGHQHLQFQWGGCTYAWGRVAHTHPAGDKGGCLSPARPWAFRCVELQTGRWVCAAIPRRAFRKLGYIDVYEPSLQHVLVATGFKVLDSPFK